MKGILLNLITNQSVDRNKLMQVILFALIFGLVKINSVASVFILANFSPSIEAFGAIDYALALGIIIGIPLNAGLPGAYPYFILKLKKKAYESIFYFHGWLLSSIVIGIQISIYLFQIDLPTTFLLTILITGIFCLQILASVMFKSNEKLFTALLFEGGFFLVLNSYNFYLYQTGNNLDSSVLINWLFIYLICLNVYFFIRFISSQGVKQNGFQKDTSVLQSSGSKIKKQISYSNLILSLWKTYKSVIQFGLPLIAGSLLIISLTGSARIIIERWIGMDAVGIYGLYFRLAALIVLVHQIINIAFFKKIYTSDPKSLDRWFEYFLAFIISVSFIAFAVIPVTATPYIEILKTTWDEYQGLYLVLSFQMFFWIVLALFENIIYRENLSKKCNPGLLVIFFLMISIIFSIKYFGVLNLMVLVFMNALAIYLSCEWQVYLLKQKSLNFPKTKRLLRILVTCLILYSSFQLLPL